MSWVALRSCVSQTTLVVIYKFLIQGLYYKKLDGREYRVTLYRFVFVDLGWVG